MCEVEQHNVWDQGLSANEQSGVVMVPVTSLGGSSRPLIVWLLIIWGIMTEKATILHIGIAVIEGDLCIRPSVCSRRPSGRHIYSVKHSSRWAQIVFVIWRQRARACFFAPLQIAPLQMTEHGRRTKFRSLPSKWEVNGVMLLLDEWLRFQIVFCISPE